jgi:hypothetical protein
MDREMLSESELDGRLHRGNPVSRAALDDAGVRAALASVRRNVESGAHREAASHLAGRHVYRRRWVTLGAATLAAAVASLVGVETLTGGAGSAGFPLAVPPAAAAQLGQVAHAAAAEAMPGPDQFTYLAYKLEVTADPSFGGASVDYTYAQIVQSWNGSVPHDAGRGRDTSEGISFATPQDQANYLANKSAFDSEFSRSVGMELAGTDDPTATGLLGDSVYPPRAPKENGNLSQIQEEVEAGTERPNGPQALLADLTASLDAQPEDLWAGLFTILRDSTNAQLRATAYQALSYVPGTKVLGNRTDQLGRVGVAIQFTSGYANSGPDTIIVSPSTGYLLEDDNSINTPKDGVSERDVYLQRGIVNSVTALPGGGSQPFTAATQTVDLTTGTMKPTLQTTTSTSPTSTSTPQTTTPASQTTTSAPQATTSAPQTTTSTPQTTTPASQTTASTPQTTTSSQS